MGAVVDVLAAEVPPVHLEEVLLLTGLDPQRLPPDLNAMGGRYGVVERLIPKATAKLGLPHAAIAEQNDFHLIFDLRRKVELAPGRSATGGDNCR